jgi:hypothetical protein
MSLTGDCNWSTYLGDLIAMYNNTPHASIGNATPNDAFTDFWGLRKMFRDNKSYNSKLRKDVACMLQPEDQVRLLMNKPRFEKEGPNYSELVYKVRRMEGNRFVLIDSQGEEVCRRYAECELLKCEGEQHGNVGAEAVAHATQKAQTKRVVVHKEKIARDVVAANQIIQKCRSKKPIAKLVKDKLKRLPQTKGAWFVVQPDDGKQLRGRSNTGPTEWWKS